MPDVAGMAGVAGVADSAGATRLAAAPGTGGRVAVVVGVDGSGRTHRLNQLAEELAANGLTVVRMNPPLGTHDAMALLLAGATNPRQVLLVDDPHRLSATELQQLTAAAQQGIRIVLARRPTISSRELAELDEVVARTGRVERIEPLTVAATAALLAAHTGAVPAPQQAQTIHRASGGLPAIAVAVALDPSGALVPSAELVARMQRRLAMLEPNAANLARLLALQLDLSDAVLAAASEQDSAQLVTAMRTLRDDGLLITGAESMIPAVAQAILAELPAAQKRRVHEALAHALLQQGSDVVVAATQLRAARASTAAAAQAFRGAGDRLRFQDPAAALLWYDDALAAGADAASVAAGRSEAAAQLGLPIDAHSNSASDAARLAWVDGAAQAHQGRAVRAAERLASTAPPGPVLAVPSLVATGQLEAARRAAAQTDQAAQGETPTGLRRLAEATLVAATDPSAAVPLLVEAAELLDRVPPSLVLPDTAHALGAIIAVNAGDAATAVHLLEKALATNAGGPVHQARHRLLLAWVRLRAGRYDTAVAELSAVASAELTGRDSLLRAAIGAGIARRSGDVARLRDAWTRVEPVLARRAVDLFAVEPVEELLAAATRLRHAARVAPIVDTLDEMVAGLGSPPAWVVALGWLRLQVAIATEDDAAAAQAAGVAAQRMQAVAGIVTGARQGAQCQAARLWAQVLAGDRAADRGDHAGDRAADGTGEVAADAVIAAADALAAVELPWEGSRLAGQAAIRTTDASAARRLLERARELSSAEVSVDAREAATAAPGGLSEREVEVAKMVLAGDTYRAIGARLFISPKTVEHHVARIRTKLGATTRAEFVAALRGVLPEA